MSKYTVEQLKLKDPRVVDYLRVKEYGSDLENFFFKEYTEVCSTTTNTKIFAIVVDQKIETLGVVSLEQHGRGEFIRIRPIFDELVGLDDLVRTTISSYKNSSIRGIFIGPVGGFRDEISLHGYRVYSRWYSSTSNTLKAKLATRGSSFDYEKITRRNIYRYERELSKYITEYDNSLNSIKNETLEIRLHNTHLDRDRKYQVKLNYFIESMLRSQAWNLLILSINDEHCGYLSSKSELSGMQFPTVHINTTHQSKYLSQAYSAIISECAVRRVKYIGTRVYEKDTEAKALAQSWYHTPIATEYFKLL